MSDVTRLKNRARREEQRENWSRAIELYTKALSESQQRADSVSDVSLYNRIGDIYLRIGQKNTAVRYYEEAIERYAEHGLHASAIALCNKVLRIHTGRSSIYLQLGRLHLATNLIADAHAHYLRYAKSMREFGDDEAALEGLEELIDATGEAKIVDLWTEYLSSAIAPGVAEERVEAFRGALTSHGFDPDAILDKVREAERGTDSTTPPTTDLDDSGIDSAAEEEVVPLPLLEHQAAETDAPSVFTREGIPEDQEPLDEDGSILSEEIFSLEESSFLDEVGTGVSAEALTGSAGPASEAISDSDDEVPEFLEGESTPWEMDEEEAEAWQPAPDGPGVEGPATWDAEPILDRVEAPPVESPTVSDSPEIGARDACEAPVFEPHEDEALLVASSDGVEPSLEAQGT
jgi:hypothetical protein